MTDFHLLIIGWYRQNQRHLPWRETKDPYKIWLSEVILQQTRVDQGLNYYLKFVDHYPTVQDLANATEQQVLNDWQGLGYYSRARNIHKTAQIVTQEYNGQFPNNYDGLIKLKGIGPYTAAAISSIAFNEKKAVVDGNVYRFFARLFDIPTPIDSTQGKKEFQELADKLIDAKHPDLFNQAIMEFGATVCTPKNPLCNSCIFTDTCQALTKNKIAERPVKSKKTKVRDRFFNYILFTNGKELQIQQRTQKGIWHNMFEPFLIESDHKLTAKELKNELNKISISEEAIAIDKEYKHILSHQHIYAQFYIINSLSVNNNLKTITFKELEHYPIPRLIDRFLDDYSSEIFS